MGHFDEVATKYLDDKEATNFAITEEIESNTGELIGDFKLYPNAASNKSIFGVNAKVVKFYVYVFILGPFCIAGFFGNSLTFYAFARNKKSSTTTYLCQVLALADMIVLISYSFYIPMHIFTYLKYIGKSEYYENMVSMYLLYVGTVIGQFGILGTTYVTVLLGMNRYIVVCYPLHASRISTKANITKAITVLTLFLILYGSVAPLRFDIKHVDVQNETYALLVPTEFMGSRLEFIYSTISTPIIYYLIPLTLLIFVTFRLIFNLRKVKQKRAQMSVKTKNQDKNVTRVLVIVLVLFTICQLVTIAMRFMYFFAPEIHSEIENLQVLGTSLQVLNSSINFVVYIAFSKSFRQIIFLQLCIASAKRKKDLRFQAKTEQNVIRDKITES